MLMKRVLFSLLFLPLLLLNSCEQNADVDLPVVSPKLVVQCFITPQDTLLRVRVTKSRPVFTTGNGPINDAPVQNAAVLLTNTTNGSAVSLSFDSQLGEFTYPASGFAIVSGNSYRLDVSAPEMDAVHAETTVPAAVPSDFTATMTYSLDTSSGTWNYSISTSFSFTDLITENDLYRTTTNMIAYDSSVNDSVAWSYGDELYADDGRNGEQVTRSNSILYQAPPQAFATVRPHAMNFCLMHCSKEYYYFHQALQNYNGGDDPFSEPTLMYSNVTGGYGIFAGATYRKVTVNF